MNCRSTLVILTGFIFAVTACGAPPPSDTAGDSATVAPAPPSVIRIDNVGLATPESVLHDPEADVYLVSNINGSPTGVDDNGFISRIAPDGTVIELKWIDGARDEVTLDAPKGTAIIGDTLYVADISYVRSFDRETGEPQGEVEIPGATFVNDLAAGRDGWLLVSDSGMAFGPDGPEDTGSAAVYAISPEGDVMTLAAGTDLDKPNGVIDSQAYDGVVVAPFGSNMVYVLDESGERVDLAELPDGGLDGVVETRDGRLLVTSWGGSAVFEITPDAIVEKFTGDLPAPADMGYDADRDVVMVPLFNDDAVVILPAAS